MKNISETLLSIQVTVFTLILPVIQYLISKNEELSSITFKYLIKSAKYKLFFSLQFAICFYFLIISHYDKISTLHYWCNIICFLFSLSITLYIFVWGIKKVNYNYIVKQILSSFRSPGGELNKNLINFYSKMGRFKITASKKYVFDEEIYISKSSDFIEIKTTEKGVIEDIKIDEIDLILKKYYTIISAIFIKVEIGTIINYVESQREEILMYICIKSKTHNTDEELLLKEWNNNKDKLEEKLKKYFIIKQNNTSTENIDYLNEFIRIFLVSRFDSKENEEIISSLNENLVSISKYYNSSFRSTVINQDVNYLIEIFKIKLNEYEKGYFNYRGAINFVKIISQYGLVKNEYNIIYKAIMIQFKLYSQIKNNITFTYEDKIYFIDLLIFMFIETNYLKNNDLNELSDNIIILIINSPIIILWTEINKSINGKPKKAKAIFNLVFECNAYITYMFNTQTFSKNKYEEDKISVIGKNMLLADYLKAFIVFISNYSVENKDLSPTNDNNVFLLQLSFKNICHNNDLLEMLLTELFYLQIPKYQLSYVPVIDSFLDVFIEHKAEINAYWFSLLYYYYDKHNKIFLREDFRSFKYFTDWSCDKFAIETLYEVSIIIENERFDYLKEIFNKSDNEIILFKSILKEHIDKIIADFIP